MAYMKRQKMTIIDDNDMKNELLIELNENPNISGAKARQLILFPTPMSAIRWAKWLTPAQIEKYLVPFVEENEEFEDMGI